MDELLPSLITLASFIAAAVWYLMTMPGWRPAVILTALVHAVLCLFGGFMFSAAIIKASGSFDSALIPALLVGAGTGLCILVHRWVNRRTTDQEIPLAD